MALQTKYVTCNLGDISLEQLLMALFAYDDEGNYFIRTVSTEVDCGDLTNAILCADSTDLVALLKKAVVIDPCSNEPALNLAVCTC